MSALPLPAASGEVAAPIGTSWQARRWLWAVSGLSAAWVLFLLVITWRTSNPPVVNVVQIQSSDFILVGRWDDRVAGRFQVEQELKRGEALGIVLVTGVPDRGTPATDTWVIPVLKMGNAYSVTRGQFINPPQHQPPNAPVPEWPVQIGPQCYPATDDVLEQIRQVLSPVQPVRKP